MARYIVIEVESNEAAQGLFDSLMDKTPTAIRAGELMRVVGIFVRPGNTCSCPDWQTVNYRDPTKDKNAAGVARGPKFGWWVCSRCNKPRKAGHQLVNQLLPSQTYEISETKGWEFTVDGLSITSIHKRNIPREKKLTLKKILKKRKKDGQ
jgi:hypothetical protein